MDDQDVGILRSMGFQGFLVWPHGPRDLKATTIAARLGLSVDAVRDRIARLEKEGVITGYELTPNLRLFGQDITTYHFRLPEGARRGKALQEAESVDGVWTVTGFLGNDACIDIAHRTPDELRRRVQVLGRLMGDASPYHWYEFPMPRAPSALVGPLDWRILKALRGDARRPLESVAKELGVTAKTVKRRFDTMAKEGAFDVTAKIDPGAMSGRVLFLLFLHLRKDVSERDVQAILKQYMDRWFFSGSPSGVPQRSLYVALLARSMGDVDALVREAESIPGVERAEALIPVHLRTRMAWVDEAIDERIRSLRQAAPSIEQEAVRREPARRQGLRKPGP